MLWVLGATSIISWNIGFLSDQNSPLFGVKLFDNVSNVATSSSFSWVLRGPCCVHPRHLVLHFEWVNIPGHVVTNDEISSLPLCWSWGLIPNMHLPNYYETGWIYFDDSAHKFWNVWWFRTRILHTPTTTLSFNWILFTLPDPFYTHKPC